MVNKRDGRLVFDLLSVVFPFLIFPVLFLFSILKWPMGLFQSLIHLVLAYRSCHTSYPLLPVFSPHTIFVTPRPFFFHPQHFFFLLRCLPVHEVD